MPRNIQGLYTLPLPPVIPGELIESDWANTTMDDLASALTGSLPRDGSAPMTGPLTLANVAPTNPLHATSKQYVDNFVAFSTGLPVGSVVALATAVAPLGFLLCNGQAVSRVTFSVLFAAIGTTYGSGDGSTTFNVPNLQNQFVRGRLAPRTLGSIQASSFGSHNHVIIDPGHTHAASQASHAHTLTTVGHNHGISDPGHFHQFTIGGGGSNPDNGRPGNQNSSGVQTVPGTTTTVGTGIGVVAVGGLSGTTDIQTPGVSIAAAVTGVSTGLTGDTESRPTNMALDYYIKAVQDSSGPIAILGITSSDTQMLSLNFAVPTSPQIVLHSNVAFGMVKLDAGAKVPLAQMPFTSTSLLGYFDASSGQNPSQAFPGLVFVNGNQYIVSVAGNILVRDPVTGTESLQLVGVGSFLTYIKASPSLPDGWYTTPAPATLPASAITFIPSGTISATDVQTAITELLGETLPLINNRLVADFTTAFTSPTSLRVAFQTSVVNGTTNVSVVPNGTATTSGFQAYGGSDPFNASFIQMSANTAFGDVRIVSSASGAGAFLPLKFFTLSAEKFGIAADATGTFTFGGTAPRLTGDFSSAPPNCVMVQSNVVNGGTNLDVIPNGTSTGTNVLAFNNSNPVNAGFAGMSMNSSGAVFQSGRTGAGTFLPLMLFTTGLERVRIATTGAHVGIGAVPNLLWGSAIPALQVGTLGSTYQFGSAVSITNNIYNDGTNARYLTASGGAGFIGINPTSFNFNLYPGGAVDGVLAAPLVTTTITNAGAANLSCAQNSFTRLTVTNTDAGNAASSQFHAQSNAGALSIQKYSTGAGAFSFITSSGGHAFFGTSDAFNVSMRVNNVDNFQFNTLGQSVHINPAGSLGYGNGAGSNTIQATSKTTAITVNRPAGVVTMNASALAANTTTAFNFNNTLFVSGDGLVLTFAPGSYTPTAYNIWAVVSTGVATVYLRNITGGSLSEAVVFGFQTIKNSLS